MEIVLFEPQIPQNTGNIIRTCSVTGTSLVLVKPLGFNLSSKYLKRAGLDYFDEVKIKCEDNLISYIEKIQNPFYFFSSKGQINYTKINYTSNCTLIFGAETHGLPQEVFNRWPNNIVTFPMLNNSRCLNLSNCVAIGLYEALRQQNFQFPTCHKTT